MKIKFYSLILLLLIVLGCANSDCNCNINSADNQDSNLQLSYKNAIVDALVIEDNEIINTLTEVNDSNKSLITMDTGSDRYLLVTTWTPYYSSYVPNDTMLTSWGETWITIAPEIQNKLKNINFVSDSSRCLRINQLLGLPADSRTKKIIEFWVKTNDLFRPAYDNEITDNTCGKYFPSNADSTYIVWFDNNILSSYFPAPNQTKYPWTRLGYTYDWGNPNSEIGLSEFVLKQNSTIIIKSVSSAEEYLK
jgi:hypothetical protein